MAEISDKLKEQYQDAADAIESEGLGYAVQHYLTPNTEDEELNEAIRKVDDGLRTIENILEPYMW